LPSSDLLCSSHFVAIARPQSQDSNETFRKAQFVLT
jgi:hypothetical protein